jgi:hypothetical protein
MNKKQIESLSENARDERQRLSDLCDTLTWFTKLIIFLTAVLGLVLAYLSMDDNPIASLIVVASALSSCFLIYLFSMLWIRSARVHVLTSQATALLLESVVTEKNTAESPRNFVADSPVRPKDQDLIRQELEALGIKVKSIANSFGLIGIDVTMPDGNVVKLLTERELAELHKDVIAEQKKSRI